MATTNPFDLLGDDDVEDPTLFIAAQEQKVATAVATKKIPAAAAAAKPAKLPTKPVPPSQAGKFLVSLSIIFVFAMFLLRMFIVESLVYEFCYAGLLTFCCTLFHVLL